MKLEHRSHFIFALFAVYGSLVFGNESEYVSLEAANTDESTPLMYLPHRYNITCCRGGTPEIIDSTLAINLTTIMLDYVIEEDTPDMTASSNCRAFTGKYLILPEHFLESGLPRRGLIGCQCPDVGAVGELDTHCRRLPECKNKGVRAHSGSHKCICQSPFYGDTCEKFCHQGQLMKDINGRDYCSCIPFYQGEECRQTVCLHGGHVEERQCVCPQFFWGLHCENNVNKTGTRFQRYGEQGNEMFTRDISGTVFSLVMIVVLIVSMYLLMKHRMQVQTRYLHRRPDLLSACNFPVSPSGPQGCLSRRVELRPPDDPRIYPFRPITNMDGGPPPYIPPGQRSRRSRHEVLPPLPSYEDATKMPTVQGTTEDDIDTTILDAIPTTSSTTDAGHAPVALMRQLSSASNASSSLSTASALSSTSGGSSVAGRVCSIELDASTQQAMVHPVASTSTIDAEKVESEQFANNNRTTDDVNDDSEKRESRVGNSL